MSDDNNGVWMRRILATHQPGILCSQVIKEVEEERQGKPQPFDAYVYRLQYYLPGKRLPNGIRGYLRGMLRVREERRSRAKERSLIKWYEDNPDLRRREIVCKLFTDAYEKVGYRRATGRWGGNHQIILHVNIKGKTGVRSSYHVSGRNRKVWNLSHKWSGLDSEHSFTIPIGWYANVYARGLAIVDNHLILYVEPHSTTPAATIYRVWYVRQAAGFKLELAEGYVAVPASSTLATQLAPTRAGALRKLSFSNNP